MNSVGLEFCLCGSRGGGAGVGLADPALTPEGGGGNADAGFAYP